MLSRRPDYDGLILCRLEAEIFEASIDYFSGSSEIFIRRFSHSSLADSFDTKALLNQGDCVLKCLENLKKEYGDIAYGKEKWSADQMYWIGYTHRFFCLTYGVSSLEAFKILKPKDMRNVYYPYHTMDCSQAIARMLEERGRTLDQKELEEKVKSIYRRMLKEEKAQRKLRRSEKKPAKGSVAC